MPTLTRKQPTCSGAFWDVLYTKNYTVRPNEYGLYDAITPNGDHFGSHVPDEASARAGCLIHFFSVPLYSTHRVIEVHHQSLEVLEAVLNDAGSLGWQIGALSPTLNREGAKYFIVVLVQNPSLVASNWEINHRNG